MSELVRIVEPDPILFAMRQDRSLVPVEDGRAQSNVGNLLGAIAHEFRLQETHPVHSDSLDLQYVQSICPLSGPGLVLPSVHLFSLLMCEEGSAHFFPLNLFKYTI